MPETTDYMVLGYALTFVILLALTGYLVLKARNLRAELAMLESLAEENKTGNATKQSGNTATTKEQVVH